MHDFPHITHTGFIVLETRSFERHAHDKECEFHFFSKGDARFTNGEHAFAITAGSLVFSWEKMSHECWNDRFDPLMQFYFVRFIPDPSTRSLLEKIGSRLPVQTSRQVGLQSASLFESIRRRAQRNAENASAAASHLLTSFLHDLCGDDLTSHYAHPAIEHCIQAMRDNVQGKFTLDNCAKASGVGKPYLIKLFREELGISPMQYYIRLKMDTARYLLRTTTEPVFQIAERLSFYDAFHFSRTFKKITGVPPRQYRLQRDS